MQGNPADADWETWQYPSHECDQNSSLAKFGKCSPSGSTAEGHSCASKQRYVYSALWGVTQPITGHVLKDILQPENRGIEFFELRRHVTMQAPSRH